MTESELEVDVSARIKAARLLRGLTQDELARKLADGGFPWRLAGQLERGEVQTRSASLAALCAALGFPERWFTAPTDELITEVPTPYPERIRALEQLASIERKCDELLELLRGR